MVEGPGFFSDIGKKTRDLLYKDYQNDKFSILLYPAPEISITSAAIRKGRKFLPAGSFELKKNDFTTDMKMDTNSNLLTRITYDEPAFGVKTKLSFIVPNHKSGKLKLKYQHQYAGIMASTGLTARPIVSFSGVVGNDVVSVGAEVVYDAAGGNLAKYNTGLNFTHSGFIGSLILEDKCDSLKAFYYCTLNPMTKTAVGGELWHKFSNNENTLVFGAQHTVSPMTFVKARLNNYGMVGLMFVQDRTAKLRIIMSVQGDLTAAEEPKIGLALSLKP
ncbi:mitochondrial outer membrane protein porin of 36 kDa [Senna tora]|uniref:Mitochondrial outer membrane protein porin of 36 kDa n=1 Tax=Senna tora TaxID=362788 RepID=A0A834TZG8_9FABA|nr:mitochondrial outer membrane protein porin of 36 kDa [Senna tora]